ncbi:MAG: hypothetical protein NTW50_02685 [Candidatus Berkelbacteria bacterium]|nr:hypothetical protein [Candidatus Berkelbacteria bacterium]
MTKKYEVTNNRRTKLLPKIILGQLGAALVIAFLAYGIIFYAQGNRYDFKTFKVLKTGILLLSMTPKDAKITINKKDYDWQSGETMNFPPAKYEIVVSKDSYTPWSTNIKIEPSSVNIYNNVVLFLGQPEVDTLTDQSKISLLNTPSDILANSAAASLNYSDYEIWVNQNLVTRFSTPIRRAIWYSDQKHIVYQQGSEIRILEISGTNDALLVTLSSDKTTNFVVGNNGTELYFVDGGVNKIARIR